MYRMSQQRDIKNGRKGHKKLHRNSPSRRGKGGHRAVHMLSALLAISKSWAEWMDFLVDHANSPGKYVIHPNGGHAARSISRS
jgi:hypothetical protein